MQFQTYIITKNRFNDIHFTNNCILIYSKQKFIIDLFYFINNALP